MRTRVWRGSLRWVREYALDQVCADASPERAEGAQPAVSVGGQSATSPLDLHRASCDRVALAASLRPGFTPGLPPWATGRKGSKRRHPRRSKPAGGDLEGKTDQCPRGRDQRLVCGIICSVPGKITSTFFLPLFVCAIRKYVWDSL